MPRDPVLCSACPNHGSVNSHSYSYYRPESVLSRPSFLHISLSTPCSYPCFFLHLPLSLGSENTYL